MRLESALYSSREGLTSHGQAIAVAGDNISNANTTGYKASRAEFADLLSEGLFGDTTTIGPVGSGSFIKEVRQIHEAGTIEDTGRELDAGIAGDGFFIVGDPTAPLYTRAGNFSLLPDGTLVNGDGLAVLGFAPNTTAGLTTLNLQTVNTAGAPTTAVNVFANLNSSSEIGTPPANPATFNEIRSSSNFMGTVDVFDSLGARHTVTVAFTKTAANTWTAQAYIDGADVGQAEGSPVQLGQNVTLNFDGTGMIDPAQAAAAAITAAPAYNNGATAGNFTIDLSRFTQYAGPSQVVNVTADGQGTGDIAGYEIGKDGQVFAKLSTGERALVGTISLATFTNVDGLERVGSSLFRATGESGDPTAGVPSQLGLGEIQQGGLERSTVDIANQFTELILYQRGYQASSQTLGVASTLLRDTLSLIR